MNFSRSLVSRKKKSLFTLGVDAADADDLKRKAFVRFPFVFLSPFEWRQTERKREGESELCALSRKLDVGTSSSSSSDDEGGGGASKRRCRR